MIGGILALVNSVKQILETRLTTARAARLDADISSRQAPRGVILVVAGGAFPNTDPQTIVNYSGAGEYVGTVIAKADTGNGTYSVTVDGEAIIDKVTALDNQVVVQDFFPNDEIIAIAGGKIDAVRINFRTNLTVIYTPANVNDQVRVYYTREA